MDGNAILLKLEKVPRGGLGLSLAASRERDRPTVVVVAVRSTCPLPVEVGDELLEVCYSTKWTIVFRFLAD